MIEHIVQLDQRLFLFLNSLNSPFWDSVMYALSGKLIWVPLYLAILGYLAVKYKTKFYIIILFIILAAAMADQVSVFIKNLVQRPRPCHEPLLEGLVHIVKGECGGMYGFVSSHAANSFNVAMLSLLLIRNRWFTLFILLWALVVSYTRIYLGVHYPADSFCGMLVGILVGWGVYSLYHLADEKILRHKKYFNKQDLLQ